MFRESQQIGLYTLIRRLGRGGFGEVWLAEDADGQVAVKLPHKDQVDWKSITQEIGLWTLCGKHPNVMPLVGARNFNGQIAIISEYAPDGSLEDLLKAKGKLPVEEAVEMTIGILEGLQHLHESGIIHRDLKPANILLNGNLPRLTDFGISRIISADSLSETIAGTFAYMAPECFDGKRNVQTDIWSVGVILYRMLTGNLPFPQKEQTALIGSIIMSAPRHLPNEMNPFVRKLASSILSKAPSDRPDSQYLLSEFRGYIDYNKRKSIRLENQKSLLEKQLIPYRKGDKWGFCDEYKNIKIKPKYDDVSIFVEGLAKVKQDSEFGFIDKSGKEITLIKYYTALPFSEGRAAVCVGFDFPFHPGMGEQTYGFINKSGEEIVKSDTYISAKSFKEDRACVAKYNVNGHGFIDYEGIEVIPLKFDEVESFHEGLAKVKLNHKYGFINKNGDQVVSFVYDDAESFSEQLAAIKLHNEYGFVGKDGKEIIPVKYDWTSNFRQGLAAVELNGKRGYINKAGDFVIPPVYRVALEFSDGLAMVTRDNRISFIDSEGKEHFSLSNSMHGQYFREGILLIKENNKCGFLDKQGKIVIPPKYDYAYDFKDGLANVNLDGKWLYIDKNGTEYFED